MRVCDVGSRRRFSKPSEVSPFFFCSFLTVNLDRDRVQPVCASTRRGKLVGSGIQGGKVARGYVCASIKRRAWKMTTGVER